MKRIGVMLFLQESNSFSPVLTPMRDFEDMGIAVGPNVLSEFGDVDEIGGFLDGLKEWNLEAEPVGLLRAQAISGGPLSSTVKQWFLDTLLEQLREAGSLDGLLLAMHGSMVAEDDVDVEGLYLQEIRGVVGADMPIVLTLDMHAYVTPRMTRHADAVVVYHECPHIDRRETGQRGARALERIFAGARPAYGTVKLPMIGLAEAMDTRAPLLSPIFDKCRQLEKREDVLSAAVLMTQGWLDVPWHGWLTMVITDGKPELAREGAEELAEMCWERKHPVAYDVEYFSADDSVSRALDVRGKPVVIADGGDSMNSGACGDSVHLLRTMIGKKIPDGALTIMVDPDAVAHAARTGEGGVFEFAVGGKRDNVFSKPLDVSGRVLSLQPAKYTLSGHWGTTPVNMGMSAAVRIGDVTVLLVEQPGPGSTPQMYRCAGLEPKDFKIVIVKSPAGFRANFESFAAEIILSDCPGCASPRFAELPFTLINRPLWPLDDIDDRHDVQWVHDMKCE